MCIFQTQKCQILTHVCLKKHANSLRNFSRILCVIQLYSNKCIYLLIMWNHKIDIKCISKIDLCKTNQVLFLHTVCKTNYTIVLFIRFRIGIIECKIKHNFLNLNCVIFFTGKVMDRIFVTHNKHLATAWGSYSFLTHLHPVTHHTVTYFPVNPHAVTPHAVNPHAVNPHTVAPRPVTILKNALLTQSLLTMWPASSVAFHSHSFIQSHYCAVIPHAVNPHTVAPRPVTIIKQSLLTQLLLTQLLSS
jgi:hypothetical protein